MRYVVKEVTRVINVHGLARSGPTQARGILVIIAHKSTQKEIVCWGLLEKLTMYKKLYL